MKADIHPKYNRVTAVCSCGETFVIGSTITKESVHLDVCSACHPFYTKQQKTIDAGGRVKQFQNKFRWAAQAAEGKSDAGGAA